VTVIEASTALFSTLVTGGVKAGAGLFDLAPIVSATGALSARQAGSAGLLGPEPEPHPPETAPAAMTTAAMAAARPIWIVKIAPPS